MDIKVPEIDRRLAEFDRQNSPAGRLARYANGRVKHFVSRQFVTLSGAVMLVALASPRVGAIAIAAALFGEIVDCLYLRTIASKVEDDPDRFHDLSWKVTLSAIFQATTIAFCVFLAWKTAPGDSAIFFCLAYITGASVNAGIVLPFHAGASLGRMAIYAATVCSLFAVELFRVRVYPVEYYYKLLGAMMMGYMVIVFISYVVRGQKREYTNSRSLLQQGQELDEVNRTLQTQQKEARNLALVAKGAHDSVIMSDPDGQILWTNEAFTRITGYSKNEAKGQRPAELLNGPDTSQETSDAIGRAIKEGRSHRAEILNRTKAGNNIWVETNLAPVLDDAGQVEMFIAIERDITDAKAHEAELAQAKFAAEQGEKTKSRFLATMSHEIRTPMNGIMGMTDLLAEESLSHEGQLYVDTIRDSAESLLTIINDILDFSKLDAGHMTIHPVDFDLVECLEGVLTLLRPQATTKELFLDFDSAKSSLPRHVRGDDTRLRQILMNVIGNAIKFTETGGITVSAHCTKSPEGYALCIEVADTGIGIPDNRIQHVFDQFAQAEADTTRRFGGTGLGLAISRLLARQMAGDITATSKVGVGSCFHIALSLEQAAAPIVAKPEPKVEIAKADIAGLTVLLAEDNRTNRLLIRKYMKDQPIDLIVANNGAEAVALARKHQPDIVLMDMSMPVMDGLEATRQIRNSDQPQPYILALTANAYASDKAACREAGMNGFLSKPVRKQNLLGELAAIRAADA